MDGRFCQSGDWRSRVGPVYNQPGGWKSRGYIPHYDGEGVIQHVTVHLADSLPKSAIDRLEDTIKSMPDAQRKIERRKRLHDWVDAGYGSCVLRTPEIAEMTQNTFLHFDKERYHLHAWVVMPNHFHVLVQPINGWTLSKIVASWKKFTARKIGDYLKREKQANQEATKSLANREIGDPGNANLLIGNSGSTNLPIGNLKLNPVWHREYWDRFIRNERHYIQTLEYIHNNPVLAGLVDNPEEWRWTSAGKAEAVK